MKVRLFCLLLFFGIVPGFILRYAVLEFYENREVNMLTIEITGQSKMLANQIVANAYLEDTSAAIINAQLEQISNIYDGRVMVIDSAFNIVKDTFGMDEGRTITSEEVIRSFRGEEINRYDSKNHYLELTLPIIDSGKKKVKGVFLVSVSTDKIFSNMEYMREKADMIMISMSVILFFLAIVLSIQLVKPFRKLRESLENIHNGIDSDELNITDYSETKEISASFNRLFNNMKVLDESRQEFVSNVSHELKTPLTSMKVLADSLLDQEDVPLELYQEFMTDIAQEVERENKIINDLLSLVKLDKSAATLDITTVNINELLEQILKRLRPIAQLQDVELVLESFRPVTGEIDEVKLSLAITNLVENGIKYNKPQGWVHVTLNADYQYFYITVEDSGIGIPEESMEHIYERFYRVNKSHSREIGGTGLGLAITRNSILMHRGAIKVHSNEGEGTTFSVRIPLSYIA
ncbi:MAG: ATP-binding protein [Lachnospiraceae bacterium]